MPQQRGMGRKRMGIRIENPAIKKYNILASHPAKGPPTLHGKLHLSSPRFPVLLNEKWHTSNLLPLTQIEVKRFLRLTRVRAGTWTCYISSIILCSASIFLKKNLRVQDKTKSFTGLGSGFILYRKSEYLRICPKLKGKHI